MNNENNPQGYKGFLLIRCERCGKVRAFHTKNLITESFCKHCGKRIKLENLKKLWMNCECGERIKYRTNHTFSIFDVDCPRCGNPVAVWWNRRKELYETIKDTTDRRIR